MHKLPNPKGYTPVYPGMKRHQTFKASRSNSTKAWTATIMSLAMIFFLKNKKTGIAKPLLKQLKEIINENTRCFTEKRGLGIGRLQGFI